MKKVTATVVYRNTDLFNLTVNTGIDIFTLFTLDKEPNHFETFQDMYKFVLKRIRANNFYVHKFVDFNTTWYNVQFIDLDDPAKIDRFSYK